MKIGLFFGSFNPVHIGHLIIADFFTEFLDKVWFVISPQNPFKDKSELLAIKERILLLQSAINNNKKFKLCEVELALPKPSYTINTLNYLQVNYPRNTFSIIMGSDNYENINQWKDYKLILEHEILLYERISLSKNITQLPENVKRFDVPFLDISSTYVRKRISEKKSIKYLVPDATIKLIEENKFYQK